VGKFRCVCNYVISTSRDDDGWLMVREREFEELEEAGCGTDGVYEKATRMYVCPVSGHIWVFWSGWDTPASCYEPRSNTVGNGGEGPVADSG
jgi:hypothetical protein